MAEIQAEKREILGKKVKHLREKGLIPAELYGHGRENIHLSIPTDVFHDVYESAGEHAIVNVAVDNKSIPVLINSVQRHPISGDVLAVDLYQVKMDEKVTTRVPLKFDGSSPAAEDLGGVLLKAMDEIEIEALPGDIPEEITVDLSVLHELDTSIYIKDLPVHGNYSFAVEPDTVVASVSTQREEEVEEVLADELTPEDVVVEGEEKRDEEGDKEGEQLTDNESKQENNTPEA